MSKRAQDMNVLVVDDEEKISDLIRIFLESTFSFRSIVTAPNVLQATQKFMNQEFDLIILDYILPGKNGVEYVEQLRNSTRHSNIKIILISGYLEQQDVLAAIKLGVKNIVVKPFTKEQIVSQVADVLKIEPKAKIEEKKS
jgi:DNA-binding response OmpR family regulator